MRTTSAWWLLNMAEHFRRMKLPVKQLFDEAGLSFEALMYKESRFPQDGVTKLWELAEEKTTNSSIGFDIGKRITLAGFPVLGFSLVSARNLKDGFERLFRYQKVIGESASVLLSIERDIAVLDFRFMGDERPICAHTIDMAMTSAVSMIRLLVGDQWHPSKVKLIRTEPANGQDFADYFGCEVVFSSHRNRIEFSASVFADSDLGVQSFDAHLANQELDRQADGKARPLSALVKMYLVEHLQVTELGREALARTLNMSVSTLQRRLKNEQTSYQQLLDQVRREAAIRFMVDPNLTLTEIAFLCGFSDSATFNRSFKRWQGVTPGDYRAGILS